MNINHVEEYLGAIYRLREDAETPLSLPRLQAYLNYTLISIHEMVRKLEDQDFINYTPYHGAILTKKGERVASALVRRHRIWERFLADMLAIPWEETHSIAGQLEHAAPELVTERLAWMMGDPEFCPHGSSIPPNLNSSDAAATSKLKGSLQGECLSNLMPGIRSQVVAITPEMPENLTSLHSWGIVPGAVIEVSSHQNHLLELWVNGERLEIPDDLAHTVRVNPLITVSRGQKH